MRITFWAFLLLLVSGVLGATVFNGQIAGASGKKAAKRAVPAPSHVIVDNTPLPVSGTVNVGTMPNVKIDSTGNTVQVSSSQTSPVSITNVNDGQDLYYDQNDGVLPMGTFVGQVTGLFTVPSGHRAVIEQVGVRIVVPTGTVMKSVVVAATTPTFLVPVKTGSDGTNDWYTAYAQTRLYLSASASRPHRQLTQERGVSGSCEFRGPARGVGRASSPRAADTLVAEQLLE